MRSLATGVDQAVRAGIVVRIIEGVDVGLEISPNKHDKQHRSAKAHGDGKIDTDTGRQTEDANEDPKKCLANNMDYCAFSALFWRLLHASILTREP